MSKYTKVMLSEETYYRLQEHKLARGESIDMVLTRLLNKYEGLMPKC